ncbi:Calx-beta domain-containing protein [Gaetbulibacter aestuarii]|uniref:Calx-beta domain-containing protein n=1 Tax=Gaetbulibacter aestuarii TaxID=1502358 RepID=A0ABW7MWF2_9FLAO
MKLKLIIITILLSALYFTCAKDEVQANGTGVANFSLKEITEVENATTALGINIGIDAYNHAAGTISVSVTGGEYGTDFETSAGSASFDLEVDANSLLETFSIQPVDDDLIEDNKTLTITLTDATGGIELGENLTISFTILDNDDPLVALVGFESDSGSIQENDASSTTINMPFDQESTNGGIITIEATGDAVYGTDYTVEGQTSATMTINVPAGATTASINVQPIDNSEYAVDKNIIFTITDVSGGLAIGTTPETTITIVNDDEAPNPTIDFNASNPVTIDEGAGTVTLNFDISGTTTADATIEITASGTATVGDDYSFNGDTTSPYNLMIPAGSSSASLDLVIIDDTTFEGDEAFTLDMTNASGGLNLGSTLIQYNTTIVENDPDPSAYSYVETFESNDGSNTYLNDVLGFQNIILPTQDISNKQIDLITNSGSFSDVNDVTATSDNGLNLFYNSNQVAADFGLIDNVVVTPVQTGRGTIDISVDVSYAFKNQNSGEATIYWSQTYDGSGTFNESDWTVLGSETVASMDGEGYGNNTYKRETFTVNATGDFYIAMRVTQTIDFDFYRTRWRFDNVKAIAQ